MELPAGVSEEHFVNTVTKIVNILSRKFRFGIFDVDDLKQQGFLFAIKAMQNNQYDPNKPLDNFLYIHIRNRFINYKRDNHFISEVPCVGCVFFDPKYKKSKNQCAAFANKSDCKKFYEYEKRNDAKQKFVRTVGIEEINETVSDVAHDQLECSELEQRINRELPADMRSDYLRLREQFFVPKERRERVQNAIRMIIENNHLEDS